MSLESAIADLVSASTQLTQSVNVTKATVEASRDSAIAKEAPVTTAKDATVASATAATADTATTASKLTAAAADYAAQKTTKGLAAVQASADTELKDRLHRRDPARHPFRDARPSLVMDFVRRECHRNNAAGNLEQVDLSSFMTFTRASTGTYVGPDGLIKEAASNVPRYGYDPVTGEALGLLIEESRTNLCPYGTFFSKWITTGNGALYFERAGVVSPDGTLNATKITNPSAANLYAYQAYTCAAPTGTRFTVSVYSTTAVVGLCSFAGLSQVTSDTLASTPCGGGWYRHTLTGTTTVDNAVVDIQITIWANSSVVVWGAQLEAGSFPTSYIPTPATFTGRASTKTYFDSNGVLQTAASGVAVTDYGYVDGRWVSKGLSLEPQATNLLLQSENFASSSESLAATVTADSTSAPNGQVTADKIDFAADVNGKHYNIDYIGNPAGLTYTYSVYLRATTNCVVVLRLANLSITEDAYVTCQLTTEWKRFSVSRAFALTGTHLRMGLDNRTGFGSDGAAKTVYAWGAQLETGPVATSYIPTTTAQVTRAADTSTSAQVTRADESVALSTMANWYNRDNSTFCVGAQRHVSAGSNSRILTGPDATQNELIGIRPGNEIESYDGVGLVCALAGWNNLTPMRAGIVLGRAARKISGNGANVMSGAASSKLVDLSAIKIWPYTVAQPRAGYIRQLTYFPRQLSDADLQALTILED